MLAEQIFGVIVFDFVFIAILWIISKTLTPTKGD